MKKLTLFTVVMLLIGLFAGCQRKVNDIVYRTDFKNKEFNFSFRIPKEWLGKYKATEVETDDVGSLYFEYLGYTDENGKYQPFFAVTADIRGGGLKGEDNITDRNGIHYSLRKAKNLITDKSKSEEYENLNLSGDEIKSRFSIGNK